MSALELWEAAVLGVFVGFVLGLLWLAMRRK